MALGVINRRKRREEAGSLQAIDDGAAEVEIEKLCKSFGRRPVLIDVSLTVGTGTTTCLIGPSGSGKTTLLKCVNGLERATSGTIRVGSLSITDPRQSLDVARRRIGMVFQQFNLFPHMTVLDNVALGPRRVLGMSRDEAAAAAEIRLREVGLGDYSGQRPTRLSGGQQQRVAIARALAMEPEVMLFDEVTSALDPELVKEVLDIMRDLARRGTTMMVATHELRFAREVASRVGFFDRGRLIEEGSPEEVFDAPKSERLRDFLEKVL